MKTSQTFFYNEENGNIRYLDKRGFIGELCIVISKKDKNILCLDEIKKIYNLSYKDIIKKYEKVFKKLDTNIYGLKVQPKLGLICLIDKSTEDFEKYCKKNKLKFGQEVSNINKKNLFTKEGKCDIINYKPKESKEELKTMNKKLVKRVAIASLAALMTIPSLTTTSYALEVTRHADGTYKSASFNNDQEAVEFFKEEIAKNGQLYNEFRRKDLQKQLDKYEKRANGGSKNVVDASAAEAKLAKMEQERLAREAVRQAKQAEKDAIQAAEDEANAIYGTHIFHGEAEVNAYIEQFIPHASDIREEGYIGEDGARHGQRTVKEVVDQKNSGYTHGSYTYKTLMEQYGSNPYFRGGREQVDNMEFTLSFGKGKGSTIIKDRAPHLKLELKEIKKVEYADCDSKIAVVKATYISPVDGYLNIGGFFNEIGGILDGPMDGISFAKYTLGMNVDHGPFNPSVPSPLKQILPTAWVNKGVNEFYMLTTLGRYVKGTDIPQPGQEDTIHKEPTQDMLDRLVQSVYDRKTQFLVALHPTRIEDYYIEN